MEAAGEDKLSPEDVIVAAIASKEFHDEVGQELDVVADDPPLAGLVATQELDCEAGYIPVDDEECGTSLSIPTSYR